MVVDRRGQGPPHCFPGHTPCSGHDMDVLSDRRFLKRVEGSQLTNFSQRVHHGRHHMTDQASCEIIQRS